MANSTSEAIGSAAASVQVSPLAHGFGAIVTGLDLAQALSPEAAAAIHAAWARHAVLVFPRQDLGPEALEAFTLALGAFGEDPFIAPMPGHPNILELRREPDETAQNFGAAWHSDWSFQPCPPAGTILHSKVVPPIGGDTLYADAARAFEALSPTMQRMLDGLEAVHSAAFAYGPRGVLARDADRRAMKILVSEEAEKTETHPLVRTHPVTGRKALFVNPVYTVRIEGLSPAENYTLLKFLYDHMVKDEFVLRHRWQKDMVVLWDNRSTMHFADGGYDGHLRVMHRTTLAGDRPR
ncbi:MAG: TauD/TfdA family dioxygenase [Myxococcota bacterium]